VYSSAGLEPATSPPRAVRRLLTTPSRYLVFPSVILTIGVRGFYEFLALERFSQLRTELPVWLLVAESVIAFLPTIVHSFVSMQSRVKCCSLLPRVRESNPLFLRFQTVTPHFCHPRGSPDCSRYLVFPSVSKLFRCSSPTYTVGSRFLQVTSLLPNALGFIAHPRMDVSRLNEKKALVATYGC
jgi:hypothetical protein